MLAVCCIQKGFNRSHLVRVESADSDDPFAFDNCLRSTCLSPP